MPGIAGIIAQSTSLESSGAIGAMVGSMEHEPFHRSGTLLNGAMGLRVGWVCDEGSFSDCLPIWNENKDVCVIFSGEHFADRTEMERLRAGGHACSDYTAGSLVHLYEEYGMKFFGMLNGWFSGLLIDLREHKTILFNDRYGLGRIYFHESPDGFFFASEAKALLKVLPQLRRLDLQSFGEFFSCGCVLQNRTLFSGVSLVPGGSVWTFRPGHGVKKESNFSRTVWEQQSVLSEDEYYEKLKETFIRVLPRYLAGERPVGMSLTGGLDSRMIMAWARSGPSGLPCYTHGGPYRECADVKVARRVARLCQQPHQEITVDGKFFSEFPALAMRSVYITDGAMDVSGAVGLFVNRMARKIAPIRLTGNYGSEILRQLVAFKPSFLRESMFAREFIPHVRNAAAVYDAERREGGCSFIAFKQVPWHHYARFALEQSQLTIRSPFLDNDLVGVAYQAPDCLPANQRLAARLIGDGNAALARTPTDRGPLGRPGVSGRIREQYQEFTFKAEYAYDYGMPQWLARIDHLLAPLHLERMFLGRHKYYHFRVWYRDELSRYISDVLLDPRTLSRSYLDGRCVEDLVTAHVKGHRNFTSEIHKLLTSEFIQRQLIEQK